MDKEFTLKLKERYPKLYKTMYIVNEGECPHCIQLFGVECNNGWFDLINELSEKIENLINQQPEDKQEWFYLNQVKEKFAGLRFYMNSETEEMSKIIGEYEGKSYKICESCGALGEMICQNSWYYTTCEKCRRPGEFQLVTMEDDSDF